MSYYVEPVILSREASGPLDYKEFDSPAELCGYFWRAARQKGAPKLSIAIMTHRNLESLRTCVEYVLTFAKDIDYELVLMDNASEDDDETYHFLQSVPYKHKKIIKMLDNMGAYFNAPRGWSVLWNYCEGDYILHLNDDHFVTENAVQNMVAALDADPSVGMVNPVSSNAWMWQDPCLRYGSREEMLKSAKNFNVYNPKKWEERLYVAAVAWMFRREVLSCLQCANPFGPELCYDIALRMAGYRVMLLGDTWVHHNHDYSKKESYGFTGDSPEKKQQRDYITRSTSHISFGLNFFEDICAFEKLLVPMATPTENAAPHLLSLDVKAGQGLLDLKNQLRLYGIFNTKSTAFCTQAKYYPLLYTVADEVLTDRIEFIKDALGQRSFDYCIAGTPINLYRDPLGLLSVLLGRLNPGGQLLFKLRNVASVSCAQKMLGVAGSIDPDMPVALTEQELQKYLVHMGYSDSIIRPGAWLADEASSALAARVAAACEPGQEELSKTFLLTKDFYVKVTKPL